VKFSTIATNMTYEPFASLKSATLGNMLIMVNNGAMMAALRSGG
jgi:hypothetical protein